MARKKNYSEDQAKEILVNVSFFTILLQKRLNLQETTVREKEKLRNMLSKIGLPEGFPNDTFQEELGKCNKTVYIDFD